MVKLNIQMIQYRTFIFILLLKMRSVLTHEDLVFSELKLFHCYHVFSINCCLQGSLVDQIFQVSAREAHCAPSNNIGFNSYRDNNDSC